MTRQNLLLTAALALAIAGATSPAADGAAVASLSTAGAGEALASGGSSGGGAVSATPMTPALPAATTLARDPGASVAAGSAQRTLEVAGDAVDIARLSAAAPDLDVDVLELALKAMRCAQRGGIATDATRLAVIDYSLPSRSERLWLFDVDAGTLLMHEPVAHGKNSGADLTTSFSNVEGSLQTSLGLFVTADTYMGGNGYSMRLKGLEPGFNDQALARAIVMHGAPYVDLAMARQNGRLGRSWGCPAVRDEIAKEMIDQLKGGQFLFSYYPDADWTAKSAMLNCAG
jgi:hypothetical protein